MRIFVQYPIKARPERFRENFPEWHKVSGKHAISFCVVIDQSDSFMGTEQMAQWIISHPRTQIKYGPFRNKIAAINYDLKEERWDILVFAHDDLWPVCNWDVSVALEMEQAFPLLDGALFYQDGYGGYKATAIMGRKLYDQFEYVYHPSYKSLWADNEYEDVIVRKMQKGKQVEYCIMYHQSPAFTKQYDGLYEYNSSFFLEDKANYEKRKNLGFPLDIQGHLHVSSL